MGSKPSSWPSVSTPCCRWTTDFTPRSPLQLFLNAYHYARRLKSLHGLTPYEYICKTWTELPYRFITDPTHHTSGTTHLICATSISAESFPPPRVQAYFGSSLCKSERDSCADARTRPCDERACFAESMMFAQGVVHVLTQWKPGQNTSDGACDRLREKRLRELGGSHPIKLARCGIR
jgi:hypothetical protein